MQSLTSSLCRGARDELWSMEREGRYFADTVKSERVKSMCVCE